MLNTGFDPRTPPGPGLYLHIPYCPARCRYCNFYSQPGHSAVPEAYIDALLRELRRQAPGRPATVYFGGGTPGLLTPAQVERLLHAANPLPGAEITLEANPLPGQPFAGWRTAGVNRLSLGVQSANAASLKRLGRLHTPADAATALREARSAGIENISCDILLALPGYTRDEFDETLAMCREGGASHLSAYLLKIEPGTAFGEHPPAGLPSEDEAAAFYEYAAAEMEKAGYRQYEISSWAQPGREGVHNSLYWHCRDTLGLGPAAHSLMEGQRFFYPPQLEGFLAGEAQPVPDGEATAEEYIMLQLRLIAGLDEGELERRFAERLGARQQDFLRRLAAEGLARRTAAGWALTPRGLLVQNSILAQLLGILA